ncbi:DUF4920 domain-containing protein [Aquimarina sediminis]|uniref:DUF4920 domain-containing protein n=1 Tax=Aquimarina sediminis TaxID=2070536 RepID=UPI000CA06DB5|nr:DUF4920 domain-containing protein [Aquimarina sediminis]
MNKNILFFVGLLMVIGCNPLNKEKKTLSVSNISKENYESFGNKVSSDQIYHKNAMEKEFESLKEGDTVAVAFSSTVNGVCKAKGCWMKVALGKDKETMVKFKDYGFFVPKDIENDTVIVQGKAFVSMVSVDEQRHYASDAGKSEEEIAGITTPKKSYSFIADGVLIKR